MSRMPKYPLGLMAVWLKLPIAIIILNIIFIVVTIMDDEYHGGSYGNGGGMKRSASDSGMDNAGPPKRFCNGEGPTIELRVLIQSKNAGAIIGKAGSNIKRLRSTYNASVTVPDSSGPERILSIHAPLGTVLECLREAIPCFEDYQQFNPDDDFECDLHLLVHQSQAGCVIGRGGGKIKELRDMTGSNIKVYTDCCPRSTDRVVQVMGTISKVINAVGEIFDLLQTAPPKGTVNNYDPNYADEFNSQSYGGFMMGPGGKGGRGGGNSGGGGFGGGRGAGGGGGGRGRGGSRGGMRGGRGGYGGDRGFDRGFDRSRGSGGGGFGGSRGRDFGGSRDDGYGGGRSGRDGGYDGGRESHFGGGRGGGFGDSRDGGSSTKTQVSIPKDLAGAIIGKGGNRIKQIRQQSNAQIQIDEAVAGSNDRIITISGTQDQIQNAQYLLQLSVKQHQSGNSGGGGRY
ncbi:HNRNPK [Bugula neritina]|uniref:HNRNPK n=1 Tax=Bugula neritina TaxID=10212 RepID=A0A7J7K2Q6_BUGNE|nr:HNRNPK [Bugula neritina]